MSAPNQPIPASPTRSEFDPMTWIRRALCAGLDPFAWFQRDGSRSLFVSVTDDVINDLWPPRPPDHQVGAVIDELARSGRWWWGSQDRPDYRGTA